MTTRPPLHFTQLKEIDKSPAHYKHVEEYGVAVTAAMNLSSLVHGFTFGEPLDDFTVFQGARRGNPWKHFKEDNADKTIVTEAEWVRAQIISKILLNDPVTGPLLTEDGDREQMITWKVGDRECAGTPDLFTATGVLADLKVTPLASPRQFPWHVRKMLWHAQPVWYLDGLESCGKCVSDVYLVAVAPKPPHLPVAYHFSERTIELGRKTWRRLFDRLLGCEAEDFWPGYATEPVTLDLEESDFVLEIEGEEVTL